MFFGVIVLLVSILFSPGWACPSWSQPHPSLLVSTPPESVVGDSVRIKTSENVFAPTSAWVRDVSARCDDVILIMTTATIKSKR